MNTDESCSVEHQLRSKGPVEDEVQLLEPVVVEMADAVSAIVSGLSLSGVQEEMQLPCEAVPGDPTSASARKLRSVSFSGPIPDTLWPEALVRVTQIANRVGVFELVVRVDEPGHQDVQLVAPDKAHFGLGSRKAATIFAKPDATSKRRTTSFLGLESAPIWPCRETDRRHLLRRCS